MTDIEATITADQTRMIRELNDRFRRGTPTSLKLLGRYTITSGVQDLLCNSPHGIVSALATLMTEIASQKPGDCNDPYNEADFGRIEFSHKTIFWKIDYYDLTYTYGSEAP